MLKYSYKRQLDKNIMLNTTMIIKSRIFFLNRYVHGCVQSCDDVDACNYSTRISPTLFQFHLISSYLSYLLPFLFFRHPTRQTSFINHLRRAINSWDQYWTEKSFFYIRRTMATTKLIINRNSSKNQHVQIQINSMQSKDVIMTLKNNITK